MLRKKESSLAEVLKTNTDALDFLGSIFFVAHNLMDGGREHSRDLVKEVVGRLFLNAQITGEEINRLDEHVKGNIFDAYYILTSPELLRSFKIKKNK